MDIAGNRAATFVPRAVDRARSSMSGHTDWVAIILTGLLLLGTLAAGWPATAAGQSQQQRLVVSLDPGPVEGDGEARLRVTVANASPNPVRGVSVRVVADRADVETANRVAASLQPGEGQTFVYTLVDTSPGPKEIEIFLNYADTDGIRHGEFRRRYVRLTPAAGPHPAVAIGASPVSPGGDTALNLTVANGLNESIRSMSLEIRPSDFVVSEPRRVKSGIGSGESVAFTFDAAGAESGRTVVPLSVSYTTASGSQRGFERDLSLTLDAVRNPARLALTELRVTPQGERLLVRGSASNVGATDATGVVVVVEEGAGVGPAESESTFFVGRVPASDFNSFEVAATHRTNGSVDIPLRVSYVAEDTRTNRTVTVSYVPDSSPGADSRNPSESDSGLPIAAAAGVAVVLLALIVAWRRFG